MALVANFFMGSPYLSLSCTKEKGRQCQRLPDAPSRFYSWNQYCSIALRNCGVSAYPAADGMTESMEQRGHSAV